MSLAQWYTFWTLRESFINIGGVLNSLFVLVIKLLVGVPVDGDQKYIQVAFIIYWGYVSRKYEFSIYFWKFSIIGSLPAKKLKFMKNLLLSIKKKFYSWNFYIEHQGGPYNISISEKISIASTLFWSIYTSTWGKFRRACGVTCVWHLI